MSAAQGSFDNLASIAKVYLAIEETRIGSEAAGAFQKQAAEAAKSLPDPLRVVLEEKLRKAEFARAPVRSTPAETLRIRDSPYAKLLRGPR